MLRSATGITGSSTPEIVADVRSTLPKSLVPVKNDRYSTRFPTVMFSKNVHVSVGVNSLFAQNFMTARCLKCSVSAFLINSAASHVDSDSHSERTACVPTSIFCMYAEKTLMRPYVWFNIYVAAHFVIIEDRAILENTKNVEFSKCSVHQILGSFYC